MKKVLSKIINVICTIIIIAAILILGFVILSKGDKQPSIFGFSMFRVLTESMEPAVPVNSLVIVREKDPTEIKEGDIITFWSQDPSLSGQTVTHRVKSIDTTAGYPIFTTRGDNNVADDRNPVPARDLIGKVVFVSGIIGIVLSLISNPMVFALVIFVPLVLIFAVNLKDLIKSAKKLEEIEIEEAEKAVLCEKNEEEKTPTDATEIQWYD